MAEHRRDAAKVAVKRAAARVLHAHRCVAPQLHQLPERSRSLAQVREFRGRVDVPRDAAREVVQKPGQCGLGFVEHEMVDVREPGLLDGEQRSACHDRLAGGAAARDELRRRVALRDHCADQHDVRPREILLPERTHVHINQAFLPFRGEHRGDGEEAQRGQRGAFADEFQGVLETPECVRELRVEQQGFHRFVFSGTKGGHAWRARLCSWY